ncbi:hypothetical protein BLNAU_16644 [Blattamonas nauphoetae]|uniref:Uncharacterized protein n=1 Tax=Blattamonas nauphoetae TaxID=2049346 RepID=A0ABQ9XAH1_9EUKA|nr:hypothetical protein BLNAU_16644 [Blattamonas nauphoetae]
MPHKHQPKSNSNKTKTNPSSDLSHASAVNKTILYPQLLSLLPLWNQYNPNVHDINQLPTLYQSIVTIAETGYPLDSTLLSKMTDFLPTLALYNYYPKSNLQIRAKPFHTCFL